MIKVRRLASVRLETPDIERQIDYFSQILGLTLIERTNGTAYLSCVNDHHCIALVKGAESRCTTLSFQVAPDTDLEAAMRQLGGTETAVAIKSDPEPGISKALSFTDPKGTAIELFGICEEFSHPYGTAGVVPVKLAHVAFNTVDAPKVAEFYCRALGFAKADQIEDYFIFLRCNADHHTVNFVESQRTKMHHLAFELRDVGHLVSACDFLGHSGYRMIWGPGRHVRGHNIFTYHRNPEGQIIELFVQLDQMNDPELGVYEPRPWHAQRPHKPQRWSRDIRATNLWGGPPPEGFMD